MSGMTYDDVKEAISELAEDGPFTMPEVQDRLDIHPLTGYARSLIERAIGELGLKFDSIVGAYTRPQAKKGRR